MHSLVVFSCLKGTVKQYRLGSLDKVIVLVSVERASVVALPSAPVQYTASGPAALPAAPTSTPVQYTAQSNNSQVKFLIFSL